MRFTQQDTHWNTSNMIYGDNPQKINEREDKLGLKTYSYAPQISTVVQSGNLYVYAVGNPVMYADAVRNYAPDVSYDDVLGLVDTTVFGGGERGMLLTREGIHLKEIMTNPVYCDYRTCPQMPLPGNTYFDTDALFRMFLELSDVVSRAEDEEFVENVNPG